MPTKNTVGLVNYLKSLDIDANWIKADTIGEDGYDEIQTREDVENGKRPIYEHGFTFQIKRVPWPSKTVYENVVHFLSGGDESGLKKEPAAPKTPTKAKTND